jgi:uncharacterized protein (UPF0332 family)
MSLEYALDLWKRAVNALKSAEALLSISSDDAASRAYYAAFHAVSAMFAIDNKSFSKHSAVRTAVHRDLVNTGLWSRELGEAFDALWELRDVGDYGGEEHVQKYDAENAIHAARKILQHIKQTYPKLEK